MRLGLTVFLTAVGLTAAQTPGLAADLTPGAMQSAGPLTIELAGADLPSVTCPPPGGAATAAAPLVHVRQVLQLGDRLDVLAVGSATVMGPDAAHPEQGFPYRMAQTLKQMSPQTEVTLTLRGGKGMTAEDTSGALAKAINEHAYQLVVWQTGTVEAMRGTPAQALYETIAAGAASLHDGSDLILVDPQYSRFLWANTNLEPYENAIIRASVRPEVALFRRFDLMRYWADKGLIDLERAAPAERPATAARLHVCLGRALARMVLAGAGMQAAK